MRIEIINLRINQDDDDIDHKCYVNLQNFSFGW